MMKNGSGGDTVTQLQEQLNKLGYDVGVDGKFGPQTQKAVTNLQSAFGYDVDGIVGPGTQKLITAQIGYGWNVQSADAQGKAQASQGKAQAPIGKAQAPVGKGEAPQGKK